MDYFVALKNAKRAAESVSDFPDRGTCNFDTPYITGKVAEIKKLREAARSLNKIIDRDIFITDASGIVKDGWMINGLTEGQGNRRTKMAEAVAEALEKEGLDAHVYYVMD